MNAASRVPLVTRSARVRFTALALLVGAGATGCTTEDGVDWGGSVDEIQQAVTATSPVIVSQVGYLVGATKLAIGVGNCSSVAFTVKNSSGATVFTGTTSPTKVDAGSGDTVCRADFSGFVTAGSGYKLNITGLGDSDAFDVKSTNPYPDLYKQAMGYFMYHRMGSAPVNFSAANTRGGTTSRSWSLRPSTNLAAYNGWTNYTFAVDGGHADAGDFGVYADNAAQGMWSLMNLQEFHNPSSTIYDLKGEINHGVKFMLGLLPSDATKQAAHKCHDDSWSTQSWGGYPSGNDVSTSGRHCMGQSITATYAVARTLAHAARIVPDATTATTYWNKSVEAWNRANGATTPLYAGPSPGAGVGGGDYPDPDASDDKFDAAVEMYLTAKRRGVAYTSYLGAVTSSPHYKKISRTFDWGEHSGTEATQGNLSLYAYNKANPTALGSEIDVTGIRTAIVAEADAIITTISGNGYPVPIPGTDYKWGSNKTVLNSAMILAYARDATSDTKYSKNAAMAMEYISGTNTLRLSMITGHGTRYQKVAHDRQSNGYPHFGWFVGGPLQASLVNDPVTPKGSYPAKNFFQGDTSHDQSWCSTEVTIDWNGPGAWVSYFVQSTLTSDLSTASPSQPQPQTYYTVKFRHSGKCLDVYGGSSADATQVVQWSCHGNPNQRLQLIDRGGGWYALQFQHSSKCVDVNAVSTADGAQVIQWPCHYNDNQLFQLVDHGGGYYSFKYKHSAKCVDVNAASTIDGANAIQWGCHSGYNQQFQFVP